MLKNRNMIHIDDDSLNNKRGKNNLFKPSISNESDMLMKTDSGINKSGSGISTFSRFH
jgi:hypothetical protein